MSGIKYEVLAGDDLISALRGGRTGDLLDDAAYAAADEIERLRSAITEYAQAYNDVITFTQTYLDNGGDTSCPPDKWAKLDDARDEKFAAMLKLAGVAQ